MQPNLVRLFVTPILFLSIAGSASAGPALITYRFGEMSGNLSLFNNGSEQETPGGFFSATAVADSNHVTSGDITRLDHRPGTGEFNPGFASLSPYAVSFAINVTNIVGNTALGNGNLSIMDANGDSLTADITGVFGQVDDFLFFNGISLDYGFTASDNSFDGTNGQIMIDDLVGQLFAGATSLLIHAPAGLTQDFTDATTSVDGEFIPSPAGVLALAAGFGLATRRRR